MKTGRFHGGLAVVFKVGQVVPANPRERPAGETQGAGMTWGGFAWWRKVQEGGYSFQANDLDFVVNLLQRR